MRVPMMNVRKVRMLVDDGDVFVPMSVRDVHVPFERVLMLVVRVMCVHVGMFERPMNMLMLVVFGQVQADAQAHQASCKPE